MGLRVGGGEVRGRSLKTPPGIRPSSGRTKGAIFNMLGPVVEGSAVLDLFAGSGALGIEALSRGARSAIFVERSRPCASILRQNLIDLGYLDRARVITADAVRWLAREPELEAMNVIFADPPYGQEQLDALTASLEQALRGPATVVIEHSSRDRLVLDRLRLVTARRYGDSAVAVLAS